MDKNTVKMLYLSLLEQDMVLMNFGIKHILHLCLKNHYFFLFYQFIFIVVLFCGIGETTINSLLDGGIKFAIRVDLNPSADCTKEISNATRPLTPRLVVKGIFIY